MNIRITGSIKPPRGLPESNGVYVVDLDIEVPDVYAEASMRVDRMLGGIASIAREVAGWWLQKQGAPSDEPEAQATED